MRIIAHLDMDAFFAAIEERDNPRFRDQPIVVGADPAGGHGRGVVSTANYKAREYGIHSAMPISVAWGLAEKAKKEGKPATIFTGGHHEHYNRVSQKIMAVLRKHASLVEEASVDEAYLDLSFAGVYEKAKEICQKIKKEIREQEKLTGSVGIGPNKLIAKIASDMQKPDGLTIITPELVEGFLEPLPIRKIPGIGPKTDDRFSKLGVKTIKDLKKFTKKELQQMLGKWGMEIYEKARGIDESPVTEEYEVKSIGEQETFSKDTRDPSFISEHLAAMCRDVIDQLKASDFKTFRTITITVRFADFQTQTRSRTFSKPASDHKTLRFEAIRLLLPFFDQRENPRKKLIRLIGVRIEKLL